MCNLLKPISYDETKYHSLKLNFAKEKIFYGIMNHMLQRVRARENPGSRQKFVRNASYFQR